MFLLFLASVLSCKNESKVVDNKIKEDVAFLADDRRVFAIVLI